VKRDDDRRLHIGHGPSAWATAGHRDILDACKRGDTELGAALLASHLARTAFEVSEILDPAYEPVKLKEALEHVGAELPKRAAPAAKGAKGRRLKK